MRRLSLVFLAIPLVPSWAVLPEPQPRVCAEFFHSAVVFTGTVVSTTTVPPHDVSPDGWTYRVKVLEIFRGTPRDRIDVHTENGSARFPLRNGQSYLLFASQCGKSLCIYDGGNSAPLSEANAALSEIRKLQDPAEGACIEGRVVSRGARGLAPIHTATVRISSAHRQPQIAHTDTSGSFRVAGTYRVEASAPGWHIAPFDFSYNNPDRLSLQDGQCGQVFFTGERTR